MVFTLCWIGAVVWTTMIRRHGASIIAGVVFVVLGCAFCSWIFRLGVSTRDDAVQIRNYFVSRQLPRAEIEQFRIGVTGGRRLGERCIQVLLSDGTTYRLDFSRSPLGLHERRLRAQVNELNSWLHAP